MSYFEGDSFTNVYKQLIHAVQNEPEFLSSPRGMKVKERLGVMFRITNPRDRLLYVPERKFSLSYMFAETLWYLLGSSKTEWISNYASFWDNISDDGENANSAYGARIFKPHRYIADGLYTQWDYVKEELTRDNDSRRAVIHIRLPEDSIHAQKDVPCTLALQFFIRDRHLYMITHMRSSDVILGIAYDVPAFTLFQEFLSNELGLSLGSYTHVSNSLHVYERHFEMCDAICEGGDDVNDKPAMNSMPKMMATNQLNELQWSARDVVNPDSLRRLMELWSNMPVDTYWKDWGWILLSHRARKQGWNDVVNECYDEIEFEPYRRFDR